MAEEEKEEIEQTTESFIKSLETIKSGEVDQKEKWLNFAKCMFRTLKTALIHDLNNQAMVRLIQIFVHMVNDMIREEGAIALQQSDKKIFINKSSIQASGTSYATLRELVDVLDHRKVGGITFMQEMTTEQMEKFLDLFKNTTSQADRPYFESLEANLKRNGLNQIMLNRPLGISGSSMEDMVLHRGQLAHYLYAKALIYMKKYMANFDDRSVKIVFAKKCVRTVQDCVDICNQKQQYILGLVTLKYFEEYLYHHSVNVALLAILLGQKMGLSRAQLADLGLCGLFHDIGLLAQQDKKVKPGEQIEHSLYGVSLLMRDKNINASILKRMIVIFEHHFYYSRRNAPRPYQKFEHDLFSRIIQIVDCFDILTSDDGVNPPELPDRALAKMMEQSAKRFDPTLMKLFVNTIGIYPIGTTVLLNTGEVGIVFHSNQDPARFNKPHIKLIKKTDGTPLSGEIVDLSEQPVDKCSRAIVRAMDPKPLGINVSHYLLV
ncbi:HD-GYP domain-containing protein [candidate division CSSED10-310 bacterium]|uniref:HD-GYP domain-containing protein n=1 Tax=candidate division CSSED10-310 bacterium TaxID=2855610 RepID=A0ABV6Z1D9_UNCC1